MRHQDYVDARHLWLNDSGNEWMRRNAEEIDHDQTDMERLGKPRRDIDLEALEAVSRDASVLEVGSGYGRQLMWVIPDLDLVVLVLHHNRPSDGSHSLTGEEVRDIVIPAALPN